MAPRIACLSGWGQPHDALSIIAPTATHIDYAQHQTAEAAIEHIIHQAQHADTIIGWSLGGQLVLRDIATGSLKPKQLILIATPFQFVKSASLPIGMPTDLFEKFRDNYTKNPHNTLKKAWELIAKDDKNAETIKKHLDSHRKEQITTKNWANWLHILENFSCKDLEVTQPPPTLLIHGTHDLVVFHEQSNHLQRLLPTAKLESIQDCGHAPHWHNPEHLKALIHSHV